MSDAILSAAIDEIGLRKLIKLQKNKYGLTNVTRKTLNNAAYKQQQRARGVVSRIMTTRTPYTKKGIIYKNSKMSKNIKMLKSKYGAKQKYLAFMEKGGVVRGETSTRHAHTGKTQAKKRKVKLRIKNININDIHVSGNIVRQLAKLQEMSTYTYGGSGAFRIPSGNSMKPGVYQFSKSARKKGRAYSNPILLYHNAKYEKKHGTRKPRSWMRITNNMLSQRELRSQFTYYANLELRKAGKK